MNYKIEQFLRELIIQDLSEETIRERALDLLMASKEDLHKLYDNRGNLVMVDGTVLAALISKITNDGKIAAIKFLRQETGLGLISSKGMVENLAVDKHIYFK